MLWTEVNNINKNRKQKIGIKGGVNYGAGKGRKSKKRNKLWYVHAPIPQNDC